MSQFARILRYLSERYPPSQTEFHLPGMVLDTVQLVQEAIPETELLAEAHMPLVVEFASITGRVDGEFVTPDVTPGGGGSPSRTGIAMVVWAAQLINSVAASTAFSLGIGDQGGSAGGFVALVEQESAAIGDTISLLRVPLIVPTKFTLSGQASGAGFTLTLRYARSLIQRGERLPYF